MSPESIQKQIAAIADATGHGRDFVGRNSAIIDYTNWRGERSERVIMPLQLRLKSTQWHPETQWLMESRCGEDGKRKDFAMAGIHSWKAAAP